MLQFPNPKILDFLKSHKNIFIAYSGGLDSHVLLHFLSQIFYDNDQVKLTVIHINHNLHSDSEKWASHCHQICKELAVDCLIKNIDGKNKKKGDSLEGYLRKLRYRAFTEILPKNACLITGHHQDDQAETLLLQLFRGSGPKGLAAMPEIIQFSVGYLVRPFLECSRKELFDYAQKHHLKWIEDDSNLDPKFDRNFIRHRLIPIIQKKWPSAVNTLSRASRHLAEADELLEELASLDVTKVLGDKENTLSRTKLQKLPLVRQKNLLRFWLKQQKLSMPSEIKLMEIVKGVVNSRYDAIPLVDWAGAEIRRYRDNIYAIPPLGKHDHKKTLLVVKSNLKLPGELGVLKIKAHEKIDLKKVKVSFRQGGEKVKISGRRTQDLKKLMQEWDVPTWVRDRIPLVWYDNEIIAVVGYYSVDWLQIELT